MRLRSVSAAAAGWLRSGCLTSISPPSCRGRAGRTATSARSRSSAPARAGLPAPRSGRPCSSGRAAWRASPAARFSAGTCSATAAGSKSSIELNFRSTAISLPSSASLLSTFMFRPGVMPAMTSLKLSRSIWMNLRSASGRSGCGRIAGEIAHDADDEGQLALDLRAFGLDFIGDVHARLADAVQLVVDAGAHGRLPHPCDRLGRRPASALMRTSACCAKIRQST